jgi:putative hemolysin
VGDGAGRFIPTIYSRNDTSLETEPCRQDLVLLLDPLFLSISPILVILGALVLLVLLLMGSALVSSSEVAFFSLTHNDYARLREERTPPGDIILRLKEKPRTLLATILISNNFINIAIVLLSDYLMRILVSDGFYENFARNVQEALQIDSLSLPQLISGIRFTVTVLGVTFLLVLFGEVAPKIYAKLHNVKLAKFMARPLLLLTNFFYPFSQFLVKGTNLIERRLAKRQVSSNAPSKEDIGEAIELTVRHEQDANQEIDLLKSIVKFGDSTVKQIMTSRVDVVAIDQEENFEEVLRVARESGFSRIPVYEESFDNIVGLLFVKDLLGFLQKNAHFKWQSLVRTEILYVPETRKINDMLREFQRQKIHMAIVVDEYGGTSGIITLEDILEEVIGEIHDEFDDEDELDYDQLDARTFVFEGKTLLNDMCRVIGVETTAFDSIRGDADSIAGLMLELAGQIPKKGADFSYNDFQFKIVSVNRRRIERVQIRKPEE